MSLKLPTPFSAAVPPWARELVLTICRQNNAPLPDRLVWRHREEAESRGVTRTTLDPVRVTISVTAGEREDDARHVLLHEMSHYIEDGSGAGRRTREAHGFYERTAGVRRDPHNAAFFYRAGTLFAAYGSYSIEEAVRREVLTYHSHRHDLAAGLRKAGLGEYAEAVWAAEAARARALRANPTVLVPMHLVVPLAAGAHFVCAECGHRLDARTLRLYKERCAAGRPSDLAHQIVQHGPSMSAT